MKYKLEKVRLTKRDKSFKFNREQNVLQLVISSLSSAYKCENPLLQAGLMELKQAIEQQQDVSSLIPKLAVL